MVAREEDHRVFVESRFLQGRQDASDFGVDAFGEAAVSPAVEPPFLGSPMGADVFAEAGEPGERGWFADGGGVIGG